MQMQDLRLVTYSKADNENSKTPHREVVTPSSEHWLGVRGDLGCILTESLTSWMILGQNLNTCCISQIGASGG